MCRAEKRILPMMILAGFILLVAGCGGGEDEQQAQPPQESRQMVPASLDTTPPSPPAAVQDEVVAQDDAAAPDKEGDAADQVMGETPPPPPPAREARPVEVKTAARPAAPAGGAYSLQLGSFQDEANARARVARIQELGFEAGVEEALVKGQLYHRVFVRGLASRDQAEKLGEDLRAELGIDYLVLHR